MQEKVISDMDNTKEKVWNSVKDPESLKNVLISAIKLIIAQ